MSGVGGRNVQLCTKEEVGGVDRSTHGPCDFCVREVILMPHFNMQVCPTVLVASVSFLLREIRVSSACRNLLKSLYC